MLRIILIITIFLSAPAWSQEEAGNPSPTDPAPEQGADEPENVVVNDLEVSEPSADHSALEEEGIAQDATEDAEQCSECDAAIEANQFAAHDLIQQTRMAWGTWAIVLLTGITIGLVWMTYREAKKANGIMDESTKNQLRPWVISSGIDSIDVRDGNIIFGISFKNSGQSPALHVRSICVSEPYDSYYVYDGDVAELNDDGRPWVHRGTVGPGQMFSVKAECSHGEFMRYMCAGPQTGRKCLLVSIKVLYNAAIDGRSCETFAIFRLFYSGNQGDLSPLKSKEAIMRLMEFDHIGVHRAT